MKSNFLTKVILIYDDFKGCFEKIIIFQIKTSVDNFLATFWKIWLLLIPASGHTEDFNRSRSSSLYLSSLRPVTSSSSSSNTSKVVTERSFLLQIKKIIFSFDKFVSEWWVHYLQSSESWSFWDKVVGMKGKHTHIKSSKVELQY